MRILKITAITLVLLIGIAVVVFYSFRKRLIKSILPEVEEVYIQNLIIENGVGHAHLILSLDNRDVISYNVSSIDLTLRNNQLELMHYQTDSMYTLAAGEKKDFDMAFEINTKQLVKRIRSLKDQDSTLISVKGSIVFEMRLGQYTMEIDKMVKVRVPTPPDIKIREIEYLGIRGRDSIDFNLHIGVLNYNPSIIGIRNTTYRFASKDFIESSGSLPDVALDTADTVVRIVPVTLVTNRKMELLSKLILKNDPIEYEFELNGILIHQNEKLNEIGISVIKKDKLNFDKKRKGGKIKFTNTKKKERQKKREEKKKK